MERKDVAECIQRIIMELLWVQLSIINLVKDQLHLNFAELDLSTSYWLSLV